MQIVSLAELAASVRLPSLFGWTPSALKKEGPPQNKLKLSIKTNVIYSASEVEAEDAAEVHRSPERGQGTGNKNGLSTAV